MELDTFDGQEFVFYAHNFAFRRFRCDLEAVGQSVTLDDE